MSTSTHTNSTHPSSTASAKTGGQDKLAALLRRRGPGRLLQQPLPVPKGRVCGGLCLRSSTRSRTCRHARKRAASC